MKLSTFTHLAFVAWFMQMVRKLFGMYRGETDLIQILPTRRELEPGACFLQDGQKAVRIERFRGVLHKVLTVPLSSECGT